MNILINVEKITKKLHLHLLQASITMCSAFILLVLLDINYGFFRQMPLRSASGMGKMAGSVALFVGCAACMYYVLREAYLRSRRNNITFHTEVENSIKRGIQIFRHIHPFCGVLVFLLVLGHAYILWYVVGKTAPRAIYSGFLALLSLGLVTGMGSYIIFNARYLPMRKYHRMATGILLAFVILHLTIS